MYCNIVFFKMRYNIQFFFISVNAILFTTASTTTEKGEWTFPPDFLIGTATSSYQIEGAWNVSDKGESVWDHYVHFSPERIYNGHNGDTACDSYNKFKEDVQLLKKMGFKYYRFSLSWPRILPTGYANKISQDGIRYYNDLLDELERNNIEPYVTLYHWDHPYNFQEMGGWINEIMVDLFGEYARVVFQQFGHRVKMFSTINEPGIVCKLGHNLGMHAPGLHLGTHGEYLCTHNILKAHARAYHIYNDEFKSKYQGKVGIVMNCEHYYAKYENDTESAEMAFQFDCGRYGHPIFSKTGDYPEIVKQRVAENSRYEGRSTSKLPTFSKKWINYIRGSSDYMGFNFYATALAEPAPRINGQIYENDHGLRFSFDPKWPPTASDNNKVVPEGFRDILRKIKDEFQNPPVYVMENGLASVDSLEDDQRITYLYLYMKAMLTAIKEYGCNVKAYTIWSFLDNFEWSKGYSQKFGLVHVDFNHPNRTRTLKKSAYWVSNVIRTKKLKPQ